MKHNLWMLLACIVPLLLVFLLPALGVGLEGWPLVLVFAGCFAMHLLMMRGHDHHDDGKGGPK